MDEHPQQGYFRLILAEYRQDIADELWYWERRRAELDHLLEELAAIEARAPSRECPLCHGTMRGMAALFSFELFILGMNTGTLNRMKNHWYRNRLPDTWECQTCHAFPTAPPPDGCDYWTPADVSSTSKSFAALVLRDFPGVLEVARCYPGHQTGWFVRIDETWYFLEGTRAEVLDRLGVG